MATNAVTSQDEAGSPRNRTGPATIFAATTPATGTGSTYGLRHVRRGPSGFTITEVALVLVIIGLLIGGIIKGWQLVQSSRVDSLAETAVSVHSAYLAFSDRYDHVAGDWNAVDAGNAIGEAVTGGGNDNGRLDTTAGDPWTESNAFWEHLAKGGFINGMFVGTPGEPSAGNNRAPLNVFNRPILVGRTSEFEGAISLRRHIIVGRGGSADLMRELDTKLDDGKPHEGTVRATVEDGSVSVFGGANFWGGRDAECVNAVPEWDVNLDADDCNALLIF